MSLTYDDLTPAAQHNARAQYVEHGFNYDWWDSTHEDFATIASILGITLDTHRNRRCIYFRLSYCQGDGASFDGDYRYNPEASTAIRAYAPTDTALHDIADRLTHIGVTTRLTDPEAEPPWAKIRSYRDHCVSVDSEHDEHARIFNDLTDWLYDRLRDEYEHLSSDESVAEAIRANEYQFTEEGEIA